MEVHSVDHQEDILQREIKKNSTFSNANEAYSFVRKIIPDLQAKGYLAASVDSIQISGNTYSIAVFIGNVYKWAVVDLNELPEIVLSQNGWSKTQWQGKILDPKLIARISEKTLQWAEQNGYPFAAVWLEVQNKKNEVFAAFKMEKGTLQTIDSISIEGDAKISRNYLLRYLELKDGEIYNEKKLRNISTRLNELAFLQQSFPWKMDFATTGNQLHLYIKEKKSNTLSAIFGLLPNSVETGKFLLTADAAFLFQNILGNGEYMNVTYQNLQYRSPRFKANVIYPYLFHTLLGLDASFDLFKKDTTFRRTTFHAGLRYQLNATDYVKVFYQNQSNRLGVVDTDFVKTNKRLPDDVDVTATGGGLEINFSRVDNRIIPRNGFDVKLTSTVLQRKIRASDEITGLKDASGFDYAALYDTLVQRSRQLFITGAADYYIPFTGKIILKTAYNGGYMYGKNFFHNELYQIGGFRLLRGFDEQSIYASQYHVASLELRLLLDGNSYFYFFSDNGWVQTKFSLQSLTDIYNGFGIGTTLQTKSGLFSISYGLGRHNGNPVQFRQSKIHFGYAAYF